jgi:opacity protein-like surface antigen
MNKTLEIVALLFIFLCVTAPGNAQNRSSNLNLGLQIVQPLGDFADQYEGVPAGVAGSFSLPVRKSAIEWGIGFAWNSMGSDDRDIIARVNEDNAATQLAKGQLTVRNTSTRYIVHARFRPFNGKIQPYADVFSGLEVFKTKSNITIDDNSYTTELSENRDHLDMTFFVGWAAGVRVRVAPNIFVEGRFESINGGRVKYVDSESVEVNNDNSIDFELRESLTNRAVYQVGVAFGF